MMMLLAHPLVSVAATLVQAAYWGLLLWFFPFTAILIPLTGVWLPNLLGLMIVYNQLNQDFKIEERQLGGAARQPETDDAAPEEDDID